MEDKPSIYDAGYLSYIGRQKNESAKRRYVAGRIKELKMFGDSISLYDLNQIAMINCIESDARRMFDK
jgi:hypothetical protein